MNNSNRTTSPAGDEVSAAELDALSEEVRNAFKDALPAQSSTSGAEPHLSDGELTQYLASAGSATDRNRIERHLESCVECRTIALVASTQEAVSTRAPAADQRSLRTWTLAATVLLAMALGTWWLWGGGDSESLGLDLAAYQGLDDGQGAVELLERGAWPRSALMERFQPAAPDAVARSLFQQPPRPVSPRWSTLPSAAVAGEVQFVFSKASVELGATTQSAAVARYEVVVLDSREVPVAKWAVSEGVPGDPTASGSMDWFLTSSYPAAAPPLTAGGVYAWKVNTLLGDEVHASAYVPFAVLSDQEQRELKSSLRGLQRRPVGRALAFAEVGALDAAARELLTAAKSPAQRDRARQLSIQLFSLTGMDSDLAERWTETLSSR